MSELNESPRQNWVFGASGVLPACFRPMDVKVLSKIRQATLRAFLMSNLVGDSLLVRTRSASIGIVGIVAAVGMALVVAIAQQGWPGVGSGPLPQPPRLVQNDPIVAPRVVSRPAGGQAQNPSSGQRTASKRKAPPAERRTAVGRVGEPVAVGQPREGETGRHAPPAQPQPPNASAPPVVAQAPPGEGVPVETPAAPESPQTSGSSPGRSGESHGHSDESHGHAAESHSHGHSAEASGHSAEAPSHSEEAPGHSDESHGHSSESHGHGH